MSLSHDLIHKFSQNRIQKLVHSLFTFCVVEEEVRDPLALDELERPVEESSLGPVSVLCKILSNSSEDGQFRFDKEYQYHLEFGKLGQEN